MTFGSRATGNAGGVRARGDNAGRESAREALRGSKRLEIQWIVVPAIISLVFLVGFGLELLT